MYEFDNRIVLTLDAGGTNFVFSAIRAYQQIVDPLTLPAVGDDVHKCLNCVVEGFERVIRQLRSPPVAISFAFPGPADYKNGIIGDLPNLKAFRGGVALGPFLSRKFDIPVFINNDGNLFCYGEALCGALPMINKLLRENGNPKTYANLLGITLGTGLGGGAVINNNILYGDNGCGADLWNYPNKKFPHLIVEEGVSIRAIMRSYHEATGKDVKDITPQDIFEIAEGNREGDVAAAIKSFKDFGEMAGYAIGLALNCIDGIVVIGGGITAAAKYIMPSLIEELKGNACMLDGSRFSRMQMRIYDFQNKESRKEFLQAEYQKVTIPGSIEQVNYDVVKKTAIVVSQIGTNRAVMCGAYAFALQQLDLKD